MPDQDQDEKAMLYLSGVDDITIPISITSFADLDAYEDAEDITLEMKTLTAQFAEMAENIFLSPDVDNHQQALQDLASEFMERVGESASKDKAAWTAAYINRLPDSSFLYIEPGGSKDADGKTKPRNLRHLPYKDSAGKVDLPHLRNALSRLGQSGTGSSWLSSSLRSKLTKRAQNILSREQKDRQSLMDRLNAIAEALGIKAIEDPQPAPLTLWKQGDRYRWFTIFSNKYRDRDDPPEILSDASHKDFVQAVDAGDWPMPELWHWHTPGTRWGLADWLAYDEQKGFIMASGWVDQGHEKEALLLAERDDIAVSHGMPMSEIRYDAEDPTVIVRYRTSEISTLPDWAAANALTAANIIDFKEVVDMPIPQAKREYLEQMGVPVDQINALEQTVDDKAEAATQAGLESKQVDDPIISVTKDEPAADPAPDPAPEQEPEPEIPITPNAIADAIIGALQPLVERMDALEGQIKALQDEDHEKVQTVIDQTPAASLADLTRARAVRAKEAQIAKNSALLKGAPPKPKGDDLADAIPLTRIPFINQMVSSSYQQDD